MKENLIPDDSEIKSFFEFFFEQKRVFFLDFWRILPAVAAFLSATESKNLCGWLAGAESCLRLLFCAGRIASFAECAFLFCGLSISENEYCQPCRLAGIVRIVNGLKESTCLCLRYLLEYGFCDLCVVKFDIDGRVAELVEGT